LASRRGEKEAIKWIVDYNRRTFSKKKEATNLFDINLKGGEKGWTPLHLASNSGHFEVVSHVIDNGGNIFKRNDENLLSKQIFTGNLITYKYLIKSEKDWILNNLSQTYRSGSLSSQTQQLSDIRLLVQGNNSMSNSNQIYFDPDFKISIGGTSNTNNNTTKLLLDQDSSILDQSQCSDKTIDNTVTYNSADMIPISDFDSPLNSSRGCGDKRLQALCHVQTTKESTGSDMDIPRSAKLLIEKNLSNTNPTTTKFNSTD